MEKLLITLGGVNYNAGAIAGTWDLATHTVGSLACFDQDGTVVDGVVPVVATDKFQFAVGRATGAELSNLINIQTLRWNKREYAAPVAKVMYIGDDATATYGLHLPTPLVVGDVASVYLVDKSKPYEDTSREIYVEYVVSDGDTDVTVQAGLVAAINANTRAAALVTAAVASAVVGNLGFSLTATTAGVDFSATPAGILEDADVLQYQNVNGAYAAAYVVPVVAHSVGHGTSDQVTLLENDCVIRDGDNNSNWMRGVLYNKASNVVAGATYTVYTLIWREESNNALINEPNVQQKLYIAIPSGEVGANEAITAMDNILNSL
jgi:hypothetical protein